MKDCKNCPYKVMAEFKPPTIEELQAYAKQIGWTNFDAEYFFHKNSSVGWVDNRSIPYREWRGVVQIWFRAAMKRGEVKLPEKSFKERYDETV
jgi:hypothetical protein